MDRAKGLGSGHVETLPSGKYRAAFRGPDGRRVRNTFRSRRDAGLWLAAQQVDVARGLWTPPQPRVDFGAYAGRWVRLRRNPAGQPLAPRTREDYTRLLSGPLAPLAPLPIATITPETVHEIYGALDDRPAQQANTYALLAAIMRSAVDDGLIARNPCRIRGGRAKHRTHQPVILTPAELLALADASPPMSRMMVLLSGWVALRIGEATELRRSDIARGASVITIARAVTHTAGATHIRGPKSVAGRRRIVVPPHLRPELQAHLNTWVGQTPDALVFASPRGNRLRSSTLHRWFAQARSEIGHPDLHWHDLRHTGATMAAQTGATLAELMGLLGHSTVAAAMVYQHAASDRQTQMAARMSELATLRVIRGEAV